MQVNLEDIYEMEEIGGEDLEPEDANELLVDCLFVLEDISSRRLPLYLKSDVHKILARLNEVIPSYRIH